MNLRLWQGRHNLKVLKKGVRDWWIGGLGGWGIWVFGRDWGREGTLGDGETWEIGRRNGPKTHKYRLGLKMGHSAHCRVLLFTATSDLDSWDSVDAKNGLTCQDWTKDTRDTERVLKWVIVRIAAFCCAQQPQIWIPEIEYYQKMAWHAQIGPQGAEK